MMSVSALLLLLAASWTEEAAPLVTITRATADRLYEAGDFPAAAVAYRQLLDATPCETPRRGAAALAAELPRANPENIVGPGEGVIEPRVVRLPAIRPTGKGGVPLVLTLVSESGSILEARIVKSSGDVTCDQAAVNALRRSRIEGARQDGRPVKMWKTFAVPVGAE
jgi:TonB family protein